MSDLAGTTFFVIQTGSEGKVYTALSRASSSTARLMSCVRKAGRFAIHKRDLPRPNRKGPHSRAFSISKLEGQPLEKLSQVGLYAQGNLSSLTAARGLPKQRGGHDAADSAADRAVEQVPDLNAELDLTTTIAISAAVAAATTTEAAATTTAAAKAATTALRFDVVVGRSAE